MVKAIKYVWNNKIDTLKTASLNFIELLLQSIYFVWCLFECFELHTKRYYGVWNLQASHC